MNNNFLIYLPSFLPIFTFFFRLVLGILSIITMLKVIKAANKYINNK